MFLEQFPEENGKDGQIEVICGSMFSGKTEELIRRLRRAEIANQKILLFKPKLDNRYSDSSIVSHIGSEFKAIAVESAEEILMIRANEKIVAIDEAQFFDHQLINVCATLAGEGVRVLVAGLDLDYLGNPFGPMPNLLCIAEYVTKVHAICVDCGNPAHYSFRMDSTSGQQVLLGAKEAYKPLCRPCYNSQYL